ncbi:MAG: 6,7-dimethyl-8-ribityllumazine synthase [Deltaproteobacteria bacterium]|nr:6,7-dimethyl-8-ribityllumazine synthase [Deltaproteobacteria bacterium]
MILIVQSLWNEAITEKLVDGAKSFLKSKDLSCEVIQVPGALEMATAIQWYANKKTPAKISGVIACGTVIKGDTYHFEVVANESARALTELSLRYDFPITNAILTVYQIEQAVERTNQEGKFGNKGFQSAEALVDMLQLKERISKS